MSRKNKTAPGRGENPDGSHIPNEEKRAIRASRAFATEAWRWGRRAYTEMGNYLGKRVPKTVPFALTPAQRFAKLKAMYA